MTPDDLDALVNDYLHRLDSALRPLPGNRRQQLLAEVTEHLTEARAQLPNQSEAAIRELLDRVGQPEDIAEAAMPDGPSRKRHFDWRLLAGVIGVVIAAAVAIPLVIVESGSRPTPKPSSSATTVRSTVTVPYVIGQSQVVAARTLTGAELVLGSLTLQPITEIGPGIVSAEVPPAGSRVEIGSAVSLTVSTGLVSPSATAGPNSR
jgi:hypothetical protein